MNDRIMDDAEVANWKRDFAELERPPYSSVVLRLIARIEADAAELRLAREVVEAAKVWAGKCPVPSSWACDEPCKAFDLCAALARYEAGK